MTFLAALARRHRAGIGAFLLRFVPGDALTAASNNRNSTASYMDVNGVLQTVSGNTFRDGHFISGVRYLLLEGARTNIAIQNRDLTQAAWVKTSATAAKDQTGIDGAANAASSLTSSAANGTCLQAITDASKARFLSAWVKRLVGAGTVQMTLDNGTTWTTVTVTAGWTRVNIPTQTLVNPTVGFRLVTSGDSIAVDFVQCENGTFRTSEIATTAAAASRGQDSASFTCPTTLISVSLYSDVIYLGGLSFQFLSIGANTPGMFSELDGSAHPQMHMNAGGGALSTVSAVTAALNDRLEVGGNYDVSGPSSAWNIVGRAIQNLGAEQAAGSTIANQFSFYQPLMRIGDSAVDYAIAVRKAIIATSAARTLIDLRAA